MSYRPVVYCRECGDALDIWEEYKDRFCECCKEIILLSEKQAEIDGLEHFMDNNK